MMSSGGKVHSDTVNWEQVDARVEEGKRERSRRRAAKKREMLGVKEALLRCFWCSGGFWRIVTKGDAVYISFLIV